MGAIRKYIGPLFKVGFWLLFHHHKMVKYDKHKDEIPFEKRYAFATEIFNRISKAFKVELQTEGLENVSKNTTLIVGNHQSFFDPFLSIAFDFPVCWVAKKEIEKFPFVGHVAKSIDVMFMNREDLRESVRIINGAAEKMINGQTMWIQPEGTRSKNEGYAMNEFKAGTFKSAFKAKVPITMIALNGTWKVFDKKFHAKKLVVQLKYVGTLEYEEYKDWNTQQVADYTHEKINKAFLELKEKDEQNKLYH